MATKNSAAQSWYAKPSAGHEIHNQALIIDEATGANIAVVYDSAHAPLLAAAPELLGEVALEAAWLNSCLARWPQMPGGLMKQMIDRKVALLAVAQKAGEAF